MMQTFSMSPGPIPLMSVLVYRLFKNKVIFSPHFFSKRAWIQTISIFLEEHFVSMLRLTCYAVVLDDVFHLYKRISPLYVDDVSAIELKIVLILVIALNFKQ